MMKQRFEKIFRQEFQDLQNRLLDRIEASLEPVEAWLRVEQDAERQQAHSEDPYLDEAVLKSFLQEVKERSRLSREEWKRIEKVRTRVDEFRSQLQENEPTPRLLQYQGDLQQILNVFAVHYGNYSGLFRDLRILDMEIRGEYDPAVHDPIMAAFSWKELTDQEMALVPSLVVAFDADRPFAEAAALALELFGSSLPVKLLALQRHILFHQIDTGRAMAYQLHLDLGFFGLSLRSVYVLQATEAIGESFDQEILAALRTPRPALLSIWESLRNDPKESRLALASRAFPYLRYDPDLGFDYLACLSIDKNPQLEEPWIYKILPLPGGGKEELPLTFAEFAWHVEGLKDQFETLLEIGNENPSLAEYLEMEIEERSHLRPYILVVAEGEPLALVPSNNILYQCQDKMRLWRYLQGLAGIHNPYVEEAIAKLESRIQGEQKAWEESQQQELEDHVQEAVAGAMQTLSRKLLGLEEMGLEVGGEEFKLDLSAITQEEAPSEAATEAPPEAEAPSDLPWIETKLCTACDECTRINKRIFVYNKDKQAVIKNPRGGPFRDIVKAAEKCSAAIIHPGKPQDPNEKNLAKWIKRAEKYQ
jgi:pyruvate-ferredoxin/flavodoxin oxidoreductase